MMAEDRLTPRESADFIVNNSDGMIKIDKPGIRMVANLITESIANGDFSFDDYKTHDLHPKTANRSAVDWIFFVDTINFSFWMDGKSSFEVTYRGTMYSGYFACCACVNRALDDGIPLTSPKFMETLTMDIMEEIFKADNGSCIPMIEERLIAIREAGAALNRSFDGSFYNCITMCQRSVKILLACIIEKFKSYRDFATYKGRKVSFLKRAQILITDIYECMGKTDPNCDFVDMNELTMFADYRVPQALAFLGALNYSDEIRGLIQNTILNNGSIREIEIRGFAIKACDEILKEIKNQAAADSVPLSKINCTHIDIFLWLYRRRNASMIDGWVPYHKTRCIYY